MSPEQTNLPFHPQGFQGLSLHDIQLCPIYRAQAYSRIWAQRKYLLLLQIHQGLTRQNTSYLYGLQAVNFFQGKQMYLITTLFQQNGQKPINECILQAVFLGKSRVVSVLCSCTNDFMKIIFYCGTNSFHIFHIVPLQIFVSSYSHLLSFNLRYPLRYSWPSHKLPFCRNICSAFLTLLSPLVLLILNFRVIFYHFPVLLSSLSGQIYCYILPIAVLSS